ASPPLPRRVAAPNPPGRGDGFRRRDDPRLPRDPREVERPGDVRRPNVAPPRPQLQAEATESIADADSEDLAPQAGQGDGKPCPDPVGVSANPDGSKMQRLPARGVVPGAAHGADDPLAVVHHLEAWMPEAVAACKLRGFVHDVGGEIAESVPG